MSASFLRAASACALMMALTPVPGFSQTLPPSFVSRLSLTDASTADPVEVSTLIARQVGQADEVILTTSTAFADSLASGMLQGFLRAPLFFIDPTTGIDQVTRQAILDLKAKHITILGGPAALGDIIDAQAKGLPGITAVRRIGGASRVETSIAIARLNPQADTVLIARADNYADALAAGALAAATRYPVLLTPKPFTDSNGQRMVLHPALEAYLREHPYKRAIIVGGPEAVTAQTERAIAGHVDQVERAGGFSRVETATALARYWPQRNGAILVDGYTQTLPFHTGFALASLAAIRHTPLLIANGDVPLTPDQLEVIQGDPAQSLLPVCGPEVDQAVCAQMAAHLNVPVLPFSLDGYGQVDPVPPGGSQPAGEPSTPTPPTPPQPPTPPGPATPPPDPSGVPQPLPSDTPFALDSDKAYIYGRFPGVPPLADSTATLAITNASTLANPYLALGYGLSYQDQINPAFNINHRLIHHQQGVHIADQSTDLTTRSGHTPIADLTAQAQQQVKVQAMRAQTYSRFFPMAFSGNGKVYGTGPLITVLPAKVPYERPLTDISDSSQWVVEGIEPVESQDAPDIVITDCAYRRTLPMVTSVHRTLDGNTISGAGQPVDLKIGDKVWARRVGDHQTFFISEFIGSQVVYTPAAQPSAPTCTSPLLVEPRIREVTFTGKEVYGHWIYRVDLVADQMAHEDTATPVGAFEYATIDPTKLSLLVDPDSPGGGQPRAIGMINGVLPLPLDGETPEEFQERLVETANQVHGLGDSDFHGFYFALLGDQPIDDGAVVDLILEEGALTITRPSGVDFPDDYPNGATSAPERFRFENRIVPVP